jgi:hypothetical protein
VLESQVFRATVEVFYAQYEFCRVLYYERLRCPKIYQQFRHREQGKVFELCIMALCTKNSLSYQARQSIGTFKKGEKGGSLRVMSSFETSERLEWKERTGEFELHSRT